PSRAHHASLASACSLARLRPGSIDRGLGHRQRRVLRDACYDRSMRLFIMSCCYGTGRRRARDLTLGMAVLGLVITIHGARAGGDAPPAAAAAVVETLAVDADSLRITLELPIASLLPTGTAKLRDPKAARSAVVDPDSLAGYLRTRMILIQDDGLLVPVIRQITI